MESEELLLKIGRTNPLTIFLAVGLIVALACAGILFAAMVNARDQVKELEAQIAQMKRETATTSEIMPVSPPIQFQSAWDGAVGQPGALQTVKGKKE